MSDHYFDCNMLIRRGIPLKRFDAGERIFLEDDVGDAMYVVRSGAVDIITFGRVLEHVQAGCIFGELALINGAPRAAAALASTATEVVVIDKATFLELTTAEPEFALAVMEIMSRRMRRGAFDSRLPH